MKIRRLQILLNFKLLLGILCILKCSYAAIPLNQQLLGKTFQGKWTMNITNNEVQVFRIPLNNSINDVSVQNLVFFNKSLIQQGLLSCNFYYRYHKDEQQKNFLSNYATDLYIQLYVPAYRDQKLLVLDLDIHNTWNSKNNAWTGDANGLTTIYTNYQKQIVFQTAGKVDIKLRKSNFDILQELDSYNITLNFKGTSIHFESVVNHASFSYIPILLQFLLILTQLIILLVYSPDQDAFTKSMRLRASEWLILHSVAYYFFTAVAGVMLIGLPKIDTQLKWYFIIGFSNCGLALYMTRKFQPVFEKFKENKMMLLGVLFFFSYQFASFKLFYYRQYWMAQSMIFLWQIAYSIRRGGKGGIPLSLLLVILISRIPLIFRFAFQNEVFLEKPQPSLAIIIIVSQLFHLFIIYLQSKWGGRFFVMNQLVPNYYNYYYSKHSDHQMVKQQCSICLVQIRKNPLIEDKSSETQNQGPSHQNIDMEGSSVQSRRTQQKQVNQPQSRTEEQLIKQIKFMLTPCRHIFHIQCLKDWMQSKLVCPFCRRQLPPLSQI